MAGAAALMAAQHAGSLGIGFSGGGFLLPFFLGVIDMLYRDLAIIKHTAPAAGASTGAIATSVAVGLIPAERIFEEVNRLGAFCKQHDNCYAILQRELQKAAKSVIVDDAIERLKKGNRQAHLAIVHAPDGSSGPRHTLISDFQSKTDIINAVAASSYVPYWAGEWMSTEFRGRPVYDGSWGGPGAGFLPCPPNVTHCIRISSLPPGFSIGNFFLEHMLGGGTSAISATAKMTIDLARATHMGDVDAWRRYFESGAITNAINRNTTLFLQALQPVLQTMSPGPEGADIWPGRRHPLPISNVQWISHQAIPGSPEVVKAMFELGRKEAHSWATEQGFKPAAGSRRMLF